MKNEKQNASENTTPALIGFKDMVQEIQDSLTELLQMPDTNPIDKFQYKIMVKNLNAMQNTISRIQNLIQSQRKTR